MMFSPRLKAVLSFVRGRCLADIGTDHAFLPIAACLDNVVEKSVACDVSPGPLKIASDNIVGSGLEDRIVTRLGFGLQPLYEGEADCVVISGMGGMNIIEILNNAKIFSVKRLILQPQRDIPAVRLAVKDLGFCIIGEAIVEDRGRSYTIIAAER